MESCGVKLYVRLKSQILIGLALGLLGVSLPSLSAVVYWDPVSSPLEQGWIAGDVDPAQVTVADGIATIDTFSSTAGNSGLILVTQNFDQFVFEFEIKLNRYASTFNDCWLEPSVNGVANNRAVQFRPLFCGSGGESRVVNNTGNGVNATPFSVTTGPHEEAVRRYRYEGSITQAQFALSIDGSVVALGGMLIREVSYPFKTTQFSIGESSTRMSADFDVVGICVALNGDDCSLDSLKDTDRDSVLDEQDNCPSTPNLDQFDSDADGEVMPATQTTITTV